MQNFLKMSVIFLFLYFLSIPVTFANCDVKTKKASQAHCVYGNQDFVVQISLVNNEVIYMVLRSNYAVVDKINLKPADFENKCTWLYLENNESEWGNYEKNLQYCPNAIVVDSEYKVLDYNDAKYEKEYGYLHYKIGQTASGDAIELCETRAEPEYGDYCIKGEELLNNFKNFSSNDATHWSIIKFWEESDANSIILPLDADKSSGVEYIEPEVEETPGDENSDSEEENEENNGNNENNEVPVMNKCTYQVDSVTYTITYYGKGTVMGDTGNVNESLRFYGDTEIFKNSCPDISELEFGRDGSDIWCKIKGTDFNDNYTDNDGIDGTYIPEDNKELYLCEENGVKQSFQIIGYLLFCLKIAIPLILIGLGILDFSKAMISEDDKVTKETAIKFAKRIISGVVIFFIPTVLNFIFSLVEGIGNIKAKYEGCTACLFYPNDETKCDFEKVGFTEDE